jgi:RHS repeat-associated protein
VGHSACVSRPPAPGGGPPIRVPTRLHVLLADQLGSSNATHRTSDGSTITQRYYPWGTIRPGPSNALPTDYTFTGQKLDSATGLMYCGARWYDPVLGRFVQADKIVPEPGPPGVVRHGFVRTAWLFGSRGRGLEQTATCQGRSRPVVIRSVTLGSDTQKSRAAGISSRCLSTIRALAHRPGRVFAARCF